MFSSTINCNITTNVNSIITLFFFLVFNKFISISSCYIQGHDSGRCVDKERLDLKFCKDIVQYTAVEPRKLAHGVMMVMAMIRISMGKKRAFNQ